MQRLSATGGQDQVLGQLAAGPKGTWAGAVPPRNRARSHCRSCGAWWGLELVLSWVGKLLVLISYRENSKVALVSYNGWHQHPCPHLPPASLGGSQRSASQSNPDFFLITASALGHGASENFCVPFKNRISVSYSPLAFLYTSYTGLLSQTCWGLILQVCDSQAGQPNCPFILVLLIIRNKICININFTWYLHSRPKILSVLTSH